MNQSVKGQKPAHNEIVPSKFPSKHGDDGETALLARAYRLREAVRAAGGVNAVSRRSGVPVGTITHYLGGRDMKASAMIHLAEACAVSLGWLAEGNGPMLPDRDGPDAGAAKADDAEKLPLSCIIDPVRFPRAIQYVLDEIAPNFQLPVPREIASAILILYEHLGAPPESQDPVSLARLLFLPWVAEHREYLNRLREGASG